MKQKLLSCILTAALMFGMSIMASAETTWEVTQGDGQIKYTVLSEPNGEQDGTVSIQKGTTLPTGELVITETVTHEDNTYTVSTIPDNAFRSCLDITSLSIGAGVSSVGEYIFNECDALVSVDLSEATSLTTLGKDAFSGCDELKDVNLGNTLTAFNRGAFYACTKLESINIPSSVSSIGEVVFKSCSALSSVIMNHLSPPTIESDAFYSIASDPKVYVPAGATGYGTTWNGMKVVEEIWMKNDTIDFTADEIYKFYDTGGADGNYTNSENLTLTVKAPMGKLAQVSFDAYDIDGDNGDNGDYLKIYDGSSADDANLLATLGTKNATEAVTYTATAANGGALTFVFVSNDAETGAGWDATLTTVNIANMTIASQDDFDDFVTSVSNGNTTLNAELTANVTATTGQYIGTGDHKYSGIFNGKGNTITVSYTETTANCVALFRYAESATIANLTVEGSISVVSGSSGEGKFSAAFVGEASGNITINNCISNVAFTFNGTTNADATYGAIVGLNNGVVMISNCAATGSVSNVGDKPIEGIGGFVGWNGKGVSGATIIDSYSTQTYSGLKASNAGNNFARNGATIINSYYQNAVGADETQGTQKTATEFTDGTVADLLGSAWVQSGNDIILNSNIIDITDCASGVLDDNDVFTITLTVPSKYIDGTDIESDLYVGVYQNDTVEVEAPAVQTKGATVTYTQNIAKLSGKFTLKFTLKNGEDIISEREIDLFYEKQLKLTNEAKTYTIADGEAITVWDNGGKDNNYTCSEMKDGSFTIAAPENAVLSITGSYFLTMYHYIDLIFTKDGISRTVTLTGNWNTNAISEINSKPGEELTIKFRYTNYPDDTRGGFNIEIAAQTVEVCTITLYANGGTGDDITIAAAKDKANTLPANTFTRDGYLLAGWATTAEGTVEYNYDATITPTGDITLYAVWERAYLMHNGEVTLTAGESYTFYDSGYKYGNYANNENYTLVVHPADGEKVQLVISKYTTENDCDYLCIYDGTSADAPLIVNYQDNNDFSNADSTYTATNAEGALTIKWHSDGSYNYAGWEGTLTTVDDVTTGISDTQAPAPFTRLQNTLYFAEPTDMAVYSISGVMLFSGEVMEYTLPNTTGVYIIRTFTGAFKVINN